MKKEKKGLELPDLGKKLIIQSFQKFYLPQQMIFCVEKWKVLWIAWIGKKVEQKNIVQGDGGFSIFFIVDERNPYIFLSYVTQNFTTLGQPLLWLRGVNYRGNQIFWDLKKTYI